MAHRITNAIKVNVRVSDHQKALDFFQDTLGATLSKNRGSDTIGDFDGATVNLGGLIFDIVSPNKPDSILAKNIEKRGEGLDSVAFQVENLEDTTAALKEKGIELINRHEFHSNKIAFIHPKNAFGILIELIERPPENA